MKNKEIILKLIQGETVSITDNTTFCQVRQQLRDIKKNCTTVLSQMKENA